MPDMEKIEPIIEGHPPFPSRPSAAFPLDECYARDKRKLPAMEAIAGTTIPEPYKSLLVHNNDMTSTLEKFHGARIHLAVLRSWQKSDSYFREVILTLDGSAKRVEFGAIKINLALFEAEPRQKILEAHFPLGRILGDYTVPYHSNPKSFLKIQADDFIVREFGLPGKPMLYGRRNTLSNPRGESLAEIVEILPA